MDPQSLSFIPSTPNDIWRLSNTMRDFKEIQQEHADRLSRLERKHEDDARLKSVWGSASPFPGILSGTPQHGPVTHSSGVDFANFDDDQSNSMVRSLHLDADDEPRRFGASRANSVRFDESAKQGQWAHASRSSVDLLRTSSLGAIGGHPLFERTVSHKSDGRQSSGGQSAISGRANSLMLDSSNLLSSSSTDIPTLAPGLFILGTVPSIVRCWLNTNFKHDSMLYAAVCTGSYRSYLDAGLVNDLGLSGQVRHDLSGVRKIRVPIYLPEAIPQGASTRSSSPASQLPSLTVDFSVIDRSQEQLGSKAIQIFIGSDILRAHNADILFSSNTMTLFDDERSKLSIPFVRPENDETFRSLITSAAPIATARANLFLETKNDIGMFMNGNGAEPQPENRTAIGQDNVTEKEIPTIANADMLGEPQNNDNDLVTIPRLERRASTEPTAPSRIDTKQAVEENSNTSSSSRTSQSPAVWGSWRREGQGQNDWGGGSKNSSSPFTRGGRDQGMKVLKPTSRQPSRSATSISAMPASPTTTGQSRFFDDGKRRSALGMSSGSDGSDTLPQQPSKRSVSGEASKPQSQLRENSIPLNTITPVAPKPRSTNPIGEASAFNWLNSAGNQR